MLILFYFMLFGYLWYEIKKFLFCFFLGGRGEGGETPILALMNQQKAKMKLW